MTEQLTPTSILSLFQTTKSERQSFVNGVIERLENGEADPIKVHAQVKKLEEIVKALNSNETYKSYLLDAAEKNGRKFMAFDAEWSIKEVGTKYDYSQCNDSSVTELETKIAELSDKLKARQKFLQMISLEGIDIVTSEGEMIKIYPPSKTSTTSVAVTLK